MIDLQTREIAPEVSLSEAERDELIVRYIHDDPHRHGRDWVKSGPVDRSFPVWLIMSSLRAEDVTATAESYDLPVEAALAAVAYYRQHRALVDARILLQDEQFVGR